MQIVNFAFKKTSAIGENRPPVASIRVGMVNSQVLTGLAAMTLIAVSILTFMYLSFRKLRSLSKDLHFKVTQQRSLLRENDRELVLRQMSNRQVLENCEAAERKHQLNLSLSKQSERTLDSLQRDIREKRSILNATNADIHAKRAERTTLLTEISKYNEGLGNLAARYTNLYSTWENSDHLIFEYMSVDLIKKFFESDERTFIEGYLRQRLFETCCISLEPICKTTQCVFLDTNPRVAYNCADLQVHFDANGVICPTTRERPKACYFPYRHPNFYLLGQSELTLDERSSVVKNFKEYRCQRVEDIIREVDSAFGVRCQVSNLLDDYPAITIDNRRERLPVEFNLIC